MSVFVMSDEQPCFAEALRELTAEVVPTDYIKSFPKPESRHADMQILRLNDKIFLCNECENLINQLNNREIIVSKQKAGESYPEIIALNFLFLNNKLYGRIDYIDKNVNAYCESNGIELINVRQGYARCSTLVVDDNAVITSDKSIADAVEKNGAEVLLISKGNIVLKGYDYGFIGGASGRINDNTIVFFGNMKAHPDYQLIRKFCLNHSCEIKILCPDMPLTDIGGIVEI